MRAVKATALMMYNRVFTGAPSSRLCLFAIAWIGGAGLGCDGVRSRMSGTPPVTSCTAASSAATALLDAAVPDAAVPDVSDTATNSPVESGAPGIDEIPPAATAAVLVPPTPAGVAPRVVTSGESSVQILQASKWRATGFPALSADGMHVAWIYSPSEGIVSVQNDAAPPSGEPDRIDSFPDYAFSVINVQTGLTERVTSLLTAAEYGEAQRQRAKPPLAAQVRAKLGAVRRELTEGGYKSMASAMVGGRRALELDSIRIRVSTTQMTLVDAAGATRLAFGLNAWTSPPTHMPGSAHCKYRVELDRLAVDKARGIVVALTSQATNVAEHCLMPGQADRQVKLLHFSQ